MKPEDQAKSEVFDVGKVRNLVELMQEFDINEVDLREGRQRIHLRRGAEQAPTVVHTSSPAPSISPPPAAAPAAAPASSAPAPAAEGDHIKYIVSPMIGTFYAKANPEAEPYVKVGDQVTPDTPVCQIESMKFFNEIKAEISGRVIAVLVENEEAVDVNAQLFKIDTSK